MATGTATYAPEDVGFRESPGISEQAEILAGVVRTSVSSSLGEFLAAQRWVAVAGRSSDRRVWCSLLTGAPGFLSARDEHTVRMDVSPLPDDPLLSSPCQPCSIELLTADFFRKRRVMIKGEMEVSPCAIDVHASEVTSLCRKHIQVREGARSRARRLALDAPAAPRASKSDIILNPRQQEWLRVADRCFVATYKRPRGPECWTPWWPSLSCQVIDNRTLLFPYFSDDGMYNTIANLEREPRAGLLFLDYERGRMLEVTGRAQVIVDPRWTAKFSQAHAVVEFAIEETIETENATPLRWHFVTYSAENPAP